MLVKTPLIHVGFMIQTEITEVVSGRAHPKSSNSFHLTHLTLYAWKPLKMKTFQQTTYHVNQCLEFRGEILGHFG